LILEAGYVLGSGGLVYIRMSLLTFYQEDKQFLPSAPSKSSEYSFFKLSNCIPRLAFQGDSLFCSLPFPLPELRSRSPIGIVAII